MSQPKGTSVLQGREDVSAAPSPGAHFKSEVKDKGFKFRKVEKK